ncbi:myo-inositol transport ITR1 [Fusarium beomiforme]|uniref:Myo-inositol transport ITR1 n=1 Tax=Fusarium beomiforme TaxID=44412 RepID=A0A9P5AI56_9HYPO|nr:myo-inositol transport ITR1 [Fusarium beomiforme]
MAGRDHREPQTPGLKQRLEAWIEKQIHNRDEFGNSLGISSYLFSTPIISVLTSLAGVSEPVLRKGIDTLCRDLPSLERNELERAAEVAKNGNYYYRLSKGLIANLSPVVELTQDEKESLVAERERLFSQRGMLIIICTVSLAAFLQGHVQSSINAMSLFVETVGIGIQRQNDTQSNGADSTAQWQLGGMNAIPFLTAAFPGAPLSLPVNYCLGRRGALGFSALLIIASSIGSAFAVTWQQILGARIVGGVAMGIKAVSAPILASETAVGYWRGSTILAWQLWVACGIMIGFVINFVIAAATNTLDGQPNANLNEHGGRYHALQWIAAAPTVPSLLLFVAVCFCYESPRFYMRPGTPNYNLDRAFRILLQVRPTRLQATRDLFLIWWSTQDDKVYHDRHEKSRNEIAQHSGYQNGVNSKTEGRRSKTITSGLTYASLIILVTRLSIDQFKPLFTRRRLRNALWSSCVVALAQQLCGINVFAFYSNGMFSDYGVKTSMGYSFGFGGVNFFFGILAMRSIDIIGRRRWLLSTLPMMSMFLMAATIAYAVAPQVDSGDQPKPKADTSGSIAGIIFIYLFAAAYSPGLGPIPFTLASESFPLKNREAGASVAISINLFFAGLLTILLPRINAVFEMAGTLGFFAGLNIVAFVLIFFFVEETKQLTLEELDQVFNNPKSRFAHYQLTKRLPFLTKRYLLWRKDAERPLEYDEFAVEDRQGV